MPTFSASILYDIYDKKTDLVTLTVKFGYNQFANTLVKLGQKELGNFENNFNLDLGSNQSLDGKELAVFTTISDINQELDNVSMEITLAGGKKVHKQMVLDSTVPTNGTISGLISIVFF
jgi:hypothetical protein